MTSSRNSGMEGVLALWQDVVKLEQKVIRLEQRVDALGMDEDERCPLCEARLSVRMIRSHPVHGKISYLRRVPYCEFCDFEPLEVEA